MTDHDLDLPFWEGFVLSNLERVAICSGCGTACNRKRMPTDQQPKIAELLAANRALMTVYVMKASLKELWQPSGAWQWRRAWKSWLAMARDSDIEPLTRFARRLKTYWRGILSRVCWPMHTGQLCTRELIATSDAAIIVAFFLKLTSPGAIT